MPAAEPVMSSFLPFPRRSGKVRDVYDLGEELPGHLLIVASDRISAYDVVMPTGVPGKGIILTQMALFWFSRYRTQFENHVVTGDVDRYPAFLHPHADVLRGRSMLVRKTQVVPFECVARGYLAGSGWREYAISGTVCGIHLPKGLENGDALPAPIFTPATKAEAGHDENVPFEVMAGQLGVGMAERLREMTLRLYTLAAEYSRGRGILLADTKFEFGTDAEGNLILIDEILTPDSSRFWPADQWKPGGEQASYDKQYVRNYLSGLDWDRTPPGPQLPLEVVRGTQRRYLEAYEQLTGASLNLGGLSL